MDYVSPRLIQRLIPDRGWVRGDRFGKTSGELLDQVTSLDEEALSKVVLYQVHLVYQTKDVRVGRELLKSLDNGRVCLKILVNFTGFDIEDVDEDSNIRKDILLL